MTHSPLLKAYALNVIIVVMLVILVIVLVAIVVVVVIVVIVLGTVAVQFMKSIFIL